MTAPSPCPLPKDIDQLIGERDAAEEAMSQAYYLITGRSPEWSNLFGYKEALEEIDHAQRLLRQRASALDPTKAALVEALGKLIKAVDRPGNTIDAMIYKQAVEAWTLAHGDNTGSGT